jgi:hypothetical protein
MQVYSQTSVLLCTCRYWDLHGYDEHWTAPCSCYDNSMCAITTNAVHVHKRKTHHQQQNMFSQSQDGEIATTQWSLNLQRIYKKGSRHTLLIQTATTSTLLYELLFFIEVCGMCRAVGGDQARKWVWPNINSHGLIVINCTHKSSHAKFHLTKPTLSFTSALPQTKNDCSYCLSSL